MNAKDEAVRLLAALLYGYFGPVSFRVSPKREVVEPGRRDLTSCLRSSRIGTLKWRRISWSASRGRGTSNEPEARLCRGCLPGMQTAPSRGEGDRHGEKIYWGLRRVPQQVDTRSRDGQA